MNKKILIGIVAVVLLVGGYLFPQGNTVVDRVVEKTLGAVSSLDSVDNPFVSIAGSKSAHYGNPLTASSSVICSVQNPYNATSTISSVRVSVRSTGGLLAQVYDIATSTSRYASGTAYGSSTPALVANYKGTVGPFAMVYSPVTTGNFPLVGPTDFVNVRIATATPTAFTTYMSGTCSVDFLAI